MGLTVHVCLQRGGHVEDGLLLYPSLWQSTAGCIRSLDETAAIDVVAVVGARGRLLRPVGTSSTATGPPSSFQSFGAVNWAKSVHVVVGEGRGRRGDSGAYVDVVRHLVGHGHVGGPAEAHA